MDADVQHYTQAKPQYRESLDFLQRILDFQSTLADKIDPGLRLDLAVAREKWQAGQPLFAGEPLSIPTPLFQEALAGLQPLLPPEGPAQIALAQMRNTACGLRIAPYSIQTLQSEIRHLAEATSTNPDNVALLVRIVLAPFFQKQAAPYREWAETTPWRRGICPMCGSEPWMARLASDDGHRILACSLCRTEWTFDRLRCPFCEGDDQPRLRHFVIEGDEAHRVYCCDRCRRYIKTVDERVSAGQANLLVEDVITSHLDILAREQGYQ
jgi:FdhE protein